MHIAIDARELLGRATGVGRYLRGLLEVWSTSPGTDRFTLLVPGTSVPPLDWLARAGRSVDVVSSPGSGGTAWEQCRLPRDLGRLDPDVLFAPGYTSPLLTRVPTCVAIHDVSFWARPEWFSAREGARRRWVTKLAAKRACRVLTISEFSASEITRWLGIPRERIVIAPPGLPAVAASSARDAAVGPTHESRAPQLLYVGSIFNRRHVDVLIRAFARLQPAWPNATLTIVGDNRTHPRADLEALCRTLGVDRSVHLRDYVPEAELECAFASADVVVFVSEYEGFGLPPLEALARGVPVVVADTAVSHEVLGEAALYVRPGDLDALVAALRVAVEDAGARRAMLTTAGARLARYTWTEAAATVLETLRACSRRP